MRTAKTDQTGLMPRLLWVFADHMGHFLGFVPLRIKCSFVIIISETMVLTRQKDVEAAKSAKLILTGL